MKDNTIRNWGGPVTGEQFNAANGIKTVSYTIGCPGATDTDFAFTSAANTTAQNIDLGAIIPAFARVLDVVIYTNSTFTGATTLGVTAGSASAGTEYFTSAALVTAGALGYTANNGAFKAAPVATTGHVWIGATPGANWSLVTAGQLTVYVTYLDVSQLK